VEKIQQDEDKNSEKVKKKTDRWK